jgi:hypothetical protein
MLNLRDFYNLDLLNEQESYLKDNEECKIPGEKEVKNT